MKAELQTFIDTIPAVADAAALKETFWLNDRKLPEAEQNITEVNPSQIKDASDRLIRFAPYLKKVFPELEETNGIIESELRGIPSMQKFLNTTYGADIEGTLMLKMDSDLPVSGSVKARGGIYEVLKHAEDLALESGMLKVTDDYSILAEPEFVGAPGGVTYGIKQIFGDNVHCFFTEPTHACCMMLGMATGLHDGISVKEFGIDGRTDADGLAVGRPSAFVGRVIQPMLSGIATIQDNKLYDLMRGLLNEEDIFIEPSSCAAFAALIRPEDMKKYIQEQGLENKMKQATHIAWATGGRMVPEETREIYIKTGL